MVDIVEAAGAAFLRAGRAIEKDVRFHELTDDEIRNLVGAILAVRPAPATEGDREAASVTDQICDILGDDFPTRKREELLRVVFKAIHASEDHALTNARNEGIEEAAVAARGNQAEHLDCEHPDGYWDGRSDAEHAVRALRRPE